MDAINRETEQTALLEAVARNEVPLAKCLLNAGADANIKGLGGMTTVHCAVVYQHELMLDVLLSATGCDVNVCDDIGMTPLHAAACRDPLFAQYKVARRIVTVGLCVYSR